MKTSVLSKQETHLPYKSIQNIINSQSLTERIFGLSTVKIENAVQIGQGISIVGQPKEKAEKLNKILNDIVSKINPQNSSSMGV